MSSAIGVMAHNFFGIGAYNRTDLVSRQDEKRIDKPTSGYKFKPVANNAAEISMSEKIRRQTPMLSRNTYSDQAKISGYQITGAALDRSNELLRRITELTAQAISADNSVADRRSIQEEVMRLLYELDKVSNDTLSGSRDFVDDKLPAETEGMVNTASVNSKDLGLEEIDVTTEEGAANAMEAVGEATEYVTKLREDVTAAQTQLENAILSNVKAEVRSEDAEDVRQSIANIFNRPDDAVLAQANQSNRGVMSLLM